MAQKRKIQHNREAQSAGRKNKRLRKTRNTSPSLSSSPSTSSSSSPKYAKTTTTVTAATSPSVLSSRLFTQGYSHYLAGEFDQACQFFERALSVNPCDLFAMNGLADCLFVLNKFDQARDVCQTYLKQDSTSIESCEIRLLLGKVLYHISEYDQSVSVLDSAIRDVNRYLSLSNLDEASIEICNNILIAVYETQSEVYAKANKYELEVQSRTQLIKMQPSANYYHDLVLTHYVRERYQEAKEECVRALLKFPDCIDLWMTIADVQESMGDDGYALETCNTVLDMNSSDRVDIANRALTLKGSIYLKHYNYVDAEKMLSMSIETQPTIIAYNELARVFYKQNKYEEAYTAACSAKNMGLETGFENMELIYDTLARIARKSCQYEKALKWYMRAKMVNPSFAKLDQRIQTCQTLIENSSHTLENDFGDDEVTDFADGGIQIVEQPELSPSNSKEQSPNLNYFADEDDVQEMSTIDIIDLNDRTVPDSPYADNEDELGNPFHITYWSVNEVSAFISGLANNPENMDCVQDFQKYGHIFYQAKINGLALTNLTETYLAQLGVDALGHRLYIQAKVAELLGK